MITKWNIPPPTFYISFVVGGGVEILNKLFQIPWQKITK